jgi:hypothetical protein
MVLSEKVMLKIPKNRQEHYRKLKYIFVWGDIIEVKIEDLHKGANVLIHAKCDYCDKELDIHYVDYMRNIANRTKYACRKCCHIKRKLTCQEKYGVENYVQTDEFKEKNKMTCKEKYGNEQFILSDKFKELSEKTCLERYGCKNPQGNEIVREKSKKTTIERLGVDHNFKSEECLTKRRKNTKEKYGVEHTTQVESVKEKIESSLQEHFGGRLKGSRIISEKIKNVNIEKFGYEYPMQNKDIQEKGKQTCIERFGVDCVFKSEEIKEKIISDNIEKYGVKYYVQSNEYKMRNLERWGTEYPSQNEEIHIKQQKSSLKIKKFNEQIYYQGTYELDFLNSYYDKINIIRGKRIPYVFEEKNHYYFPDFYLSDYNLLVEIKSTYTYEISAEINQIKKDSAIAEGFNFMFIIDKNYDEFENYLKTDL